MRVFFAIEFDRDVKNYLQHVQEEVRKFSSSGNFTLKDNFHLTLRFIGEQDETQTEQLKLALIEAAKNTKPFELYLNKVGSFNKGNKKIIWAGLQKSIELDGLYTKLESTLISEGYPREDRGYNPHITLAREVKIDNPGVLIQNVKVENLIIKVKSISLMESKRIDNRLCYVPLERAELQTIERY